ncbi:NitT/TauT family transport system ATP-binding protein [Azospirillum agricola]|uniref:ABC transporter ATP-binding protein n=1 Tax=Azospirillum agricola TaxID=1720247 RepID=UPI001AEAE29D|nr:ABC transporter ATP-binding protein [Azospirillum agricola]MBP2231914.1 NitT/TauT family transport system ATP-binding protein [Azospirillum agricola]
MDLLAQAIGHSFDGLTVLADVSLAIRSREVVAIVGPSGCGKSTLLSILGGLVVPASGQVLIRGREPPGCISPIAAVFQDFALLPWRSVEDNIRFVLDHRPVGPAEKRGIVADALRRTGLSEFAAAYPRQLSGGMKQRVGIARALAVRPAILLMDEPLSALDSQTRAVLIEDLTRLLDAERVGVAYVTHTLDEAVRLADRVVVLSARPGRIQDVADVGIPRSERARPSAQKELAALQARLWASIRDGAIAAEREVARA